MHTSLTRLLRISAGISAVAVVLFAVGCADIVTYGKDSRREGLKLYQRQQYADAAGAFRNAVKQNPMDYQSYCYLGETYVQLGQHQQAIQAFRTSLEVMNTTAAGKDDVASRQNALNGLANAIAKSDTREIETNAVERTARTNNDAQDYFLLAKIYAYRGDADSAIDAYTRAAMLDPRDFEIAKEYGLYLERLSQSSKAEVALRRAYSLNPQDDQVINALRRLGIVPGPSLLDQSALAKPIVPKGPIPDITERSSAGNGSGTTVQAPRD